MKNWQSICKTEDIPANTGRCALLGKQQVAIFKLVVDGEESVYALDNHDPFSGANVLSRGIVGNLGDRKVVASPVYKQHFCLETGECLEENITLRTFPIRVQNGEVQLAA